MDSNTTPNRRVQKLLDVAAKHGWTVEHPTPELATWLVYPRNVVSDDGFVIYGLSNDSAKVLHAASYKPVTQKDALAHMAEHHVEQKPESTGEPTFEEVVEQAINLIRQGQSRDPLDDVGVNVRVLNRDDDGDDIVVESEFSLPVDLPAADKSQFCEGALLAATTIAGLMERSIDVSLSLVPPEMLDEAVISPPSAAHAYLHLANQLRDPKTLRIIFQDRTEPPTKAEERGAQTVRSSLLAIWTAFADGLFALDPEQGAPIKEFMTSLREHADFIRLSADETFGEFVTVSDADLESLLS
jgi:hypothetical protein